MTPSRTAVALRRAGLPLRARVRIAGAAGALAGLALVLALLAWAARLGAVRSPAWVFAAWGLGLLVAGYAIVRAYRGLRHLSPGGLAGRLEESGWRTGAVRGLLEPAAAGTSGGLRGAADERAAREIGQRGPAALEPDLRRAGHLLALALITLSGSALLLGAAGVRRGPAALLWHPGRALDLLTSPLRLSADRLAVPLGDSVMLMVHAPGRRQVWLWTRSPGTTWERSALPLDSAGQARRVMGPLREAIFAHITAGARSSDTIAVTVTRPAFLASLTLTVHYPAYLGLTDEPIVPGSTADTVLLSAGSRIETMGEATVALGSAAWELSGLGPGGRRAALRVLGTRFEGTLLPAASGTYRLAVRTEAGTPLGGGAEDVLLVLRVMPDLAPVVDIPVPAGDTSAGDPGPLPLVVDAQDDHGLTAVVLERRVVRGGRTQPLPEEALALPGPLPERVILPAAVDPVRLGLQPGDTLRVRARARDNAPAGLIGRSREVLVTVPTRAELRAGGRERTAQLAQQLDSLVAASRRAQRQSEDLARTQARSGAEAGRGELDFEAAKKAEAIADRQEQLLRDAEAARRTLDQLRETAVQAGLGDSTFLERLREVREQLDRALTPELRRQLAELQEALGALDRERTQSAVRDLSQGQQRLRDALERSRELFRRAALEGHLTALEQEAKELAAEQRDWNQRVRSSDRARAETEERALARRADSVAAGLAEAARQLDSAGRREALNRAADTARAAARDMREAAGAAGQVRPGEAQQAGERAAGRLGTVQREVGEQREGQQQEWRAEVIAQLDRALLETTRLAERQLGIAEQFRRPNTLAATRAAQGAAEEAAQKLFEQVSAAGGKNALVSPQILAALVEARRQMQEAREAAASATGNPREAAERAGEAVDALNVAAYGLLRSRQEVEGAGSGSGFAEAMQRMTQLAQQQGQISQDASGLLPMMGSQAVQQQLQALAARQRELVRALARLQAQGQIDAKPLEEEAGELARRLERGQLDRDIVSRQERLFRRMLDAGRTLQGNEEDENKERQSETARPGEIVLPKALSEKLLGRGGIRLPSWDELQRLSPEERRLVTDYFRRLAGGVP
ncbi:MAG: hypothetical protein ACT4PM_12810 [Gemmatimonadales bacterium]